jgi:hypothetical protein
MGKKEEHFLLLMQEIGVKAQFLFFFFLSYFLSFFFLSLSFSLIGVKAQIFLSF